MKNLLSRISKKSVALLVAVALVLTSVATIVVASADTSERYTVTAKDPVVPMTAGYSVELSKFDVVDVAADTLVWSTDASADELVIDNDAGVIKAYKRGVYKATAGDMTVYIVVKAPNETEYVLFEADYRDLSDDDIANDWSTVFYGYSSEGYKPFVLAGADNRVGKRQLASKGYNTIDNPHYYKSDLTTVNNRSFDIPVGFVPYDINNLLQYVIEDGALVNNQIRFRGSDVLVSYNQTTKGIYAITTLNNEMLLDLQNYKVSSTVYYHAGSNSLVGPAGRITATADNFVSSTDSVSTILSNFSNYKGGNAFYVLSSNSASSEILISGTNYNTLATAKDAHASLMTVYISNGSNSSLKTLDMNFVNGNVTLSSPYFAESAPNAGDNVVTLTSAEKAGTIGFVSYVAPRDIRGADNGCRLPVPAILDVKVTLNETVDASLLPTTKMDGANAVEKVFGTEDYQNIDGDNITFEFKNAAALDINYATANKATSAKVVFPTQNGESVISEVGRYLLRENPGASIAREIAQVVIPEGITLISDAAFWQAYYLEKVSLPNTLSKIGTAGFNNTGLLEITIPDSVNTLGPSAFSSCRNLAKVKIGNSVTKITCKLFEKCYSLSSITIPLNVETIENAAFDGCTSLSEVRIYNNDVVFTEQASDSSTMITAPAIPANQYLTIYGGTGSTAQAYAQANNINFVAIDEEIAEAKQWAEQKDVAIKAPVRAKLDLGEFKFNVSNGQVVSGDEVVWVDVANDYFTLADGVITTLALTEEAIAFTGTYNGMEVVANLEVVAAESINLFDGQYELLPPEPSIDVTADAENELTYIATVNPENKTLIPNSLVALDNGKEVKVLTPYGTSGKAFAFQAVTPNATVTAQYTTENIQDDIFYLGASIRAAGSGKTAGIKFGNRLPAITYNSENDTISTNTILLDNGEEVTVNAIGTLVIPSILLRDAELKIPADQEATFDADTAEVVLGELNGQSALNIKHQTVTAYTEDFSDVKAILGGLDQLGLTEEQYKALKISAITYIQYTDASGEIGYSYGELVEKSYNDVYDVIYPEYATGAEYLNLYLQPSADGDYVYNDSEEIVITYSVAPGYRSYWNVQIKDGEGYEAGWDYRFATGTVDSTNIVKVVVPAEKTQVKEYRTYFAIRRQDETGAWNTFVNAIPGPTFSVVAD